MGGGCGGCNPPPLIFTKKIVVIRVAVVIEVVVISSNNACLRVLHSARNDRCSFYVPITAASAGCVASLVFRQHNCNKRQCKGFSCMLSLSNYCLRQALYAFIAKTPLQSRVRLATL